MKQYEIEANKPDFDIIKFNKLHPYNLNEKADICIMIARVIGYQGRGDYFVYDSDLLDKKKWVCVEYNLQNVGKTIVDKLIIGTNLFKTMAMFDINDSALKNPSGKNGINFTIQLNKIMHPQDTFSLQVCFLENNIPNMGAPLSIYMIDRNQNYWIQEVFAPEEDLGICERDNERYFKSTTDKEHLVNLYYREPWRRIYGK